MSAQQAKLVGVFDGEEMAYFTTLSTDARGIERQATFGREQGASDVWVQLGSTRYDVAAFVAYARGETDSVVAR